MHELPRPDKPRLAELWRTCKQEQAVPLEEKENDPDHAVLSSPFSFAALGYTSIVLINQ